MRYIFVVLLLSLPLAAQTVVTGTVVDLNGNPYALGTASAYSLTSSGSPSISTTPVPTNTSGSFSMTLVANTYIFTVCAPPALLTIPTTNPTPKQICFSSGPLAVAGISQDISAQLNLIAPVLGPRSGSVTLGGLPATELIPNCAVTGTVLNELVQLSTQQVNGVTTACGTVAALNSTAVIGICSSSCGAFGTAQVAYQAFQNCVFDNGPTSINDVAQPSAINVGQCADGGPNGSTGQKLGRIASINSVAGTLASVNLFTGDVISPNTASGSGTFSPCGSIGPILYSSVIGQIAVCDPSATLDGNGNGKFKSLQTTSTLQPGIVDFTANGAQDSQAVPVQSVGLEAPASVATPFRLQMPDTEPTVGQILTAASNPATHRWKLGFSSSAAPAFSVLTSGTNSTAAMLVAPGASLVPSTFGQITGITNWLDIAPTVQIPPQPTLSTSVGGGTLASNTAIFVKITFVGLSVTVPSAEVQITPTGCTNNCIVTVNMPNICTAGNLPAGVTGCTVWDIGTTIGTEKQQTASNNCVNITTATCVIGTIATGASLTTPATTGITPTPLVANVNRPDFILPSIFMRRGDQNYYDVAGVDIVGFNIPDPKGTFTWYDRFFINDSSGPPIISNALVSIHHLSHATTNQSFNGTAVDDRALGVEMIDTTDSNPSFHQSLTQYNERIISNNNFNCAPVNGGGATGESCAAAGRFITSDTRSAAANNVAMIEALAGVVSDSHAAAAGIGSCTWCWVGVKGGAQESVTNTNAGGAGFVGVMAGIQAASGNTNGFGAAFLARAPGVRFATQNVGLWIESFGATSPDWDILADGNGTNGGQSLFKANLWVPNIIAATSTIGITGSINPTGGIATTQLPTPTQNAVTAFGTSGATTDSYTITCVDVNGNESASSSTSNINVANADLTAVHGNTITAANQNIGCSSYNIYRTVSGSTCNGVACTNGQIGNVVVPLVNSSRANTISFNDTGQVGNGITATQPNTTGGVKAAGLVRGTNIVQVASDFTSAANTNLQTITGLSYTLGGLAANYSFHCALTYSQATAAASMQFGIQVATIAPTNVNAKGRVDTSTSAVTSGVLNGLNTTTATAIVTFTPSASATVFGADLDGTIELPVGGNTVNFMVQTSNSADLPTVKRGSYCQLF